MTINRRSRRLPAKFDPSLCCVACGAQVPMDVGDINITEEREDWAKLARKRRRKAVVVPSIELEQMDFKKNPALWSCYYRTILDDLKTNRLCISGISPMGGSPWFPRPVPTDPQRARISGTVMNENHWNADFHMANMFEQDWNKEAGERVGYPIHVHCWLLLDRMIGHGIIEQNLRIFIQAVEAFWKANRKDWDIWLFHFTDDKDACYDSGLLWFKRYPMNTTGQQPNAPSGRVVEHRPGNPLRIPEIQELITRVTQGSDSALEFGSCGQRCSPIIASIPLEIAVSIVDAIYKSRPQCRERIEDTRNLLNVFQWRLPNTYWQSRCNTQLVFEVEDLIKTGDVVDWASLCLGLEELLLDKDWYCNSGLNNRGRTLKLIAGIKKRFLDMMQQSDSVETRNTEAKENPGVTCEI